MALTTVVTADELFKRLYADWEIEDLVNLEADVLAQCAPEGSATLGGARVSGGADLGGFHFAVRLEHAHGHAYIGETDSLPDARQTKIRQANVKPTVHAGVVNISGLSMALASGDAMAFARVFDEEIQSTISAMAHYKAGALFRDGSGQIAQFNGAVATSAGPHVCDDVSWLREGMVVDIVDTDLTTHHNDAIRIQEVDWVNRTVTFTSSVAAAVDDNDLIYMDGAQTSGTAATSKEPIGLLGSLAASGTYLGLDRATEPNWRANVYAVNGFLDEAALQAARTRLTQESGLKLTSMASKLKLLCHPQQIDVLYKLVIPRIRYEGGGSAFDLGNSDNVEFGGIKFVSDDKCQTNRAYLGNFRMSNQLYAPKGKLHIDTEYNGAALKWDTNKDAAIVFLKEYCAFVVRSPVQFVVLTGLSELSR